MAQNIQKTYIVIAVTVLILGILACGSVQVGVVTPTPEGEVQPVNEDQEPESEQAALEEAESQTENEVVSEPVQEAPEPSNTQAVTAWLGHIASLPEGSQFDDFVILSPPGTGEFGLTGATPEIEAEIRTLRDADGPNEYVHLWGMLSCEIEDYNGCQLLVEKMQYGANYSEEDIDGWLGTITNSTFNGGPSHVFELSGEYPMWYSIHASQDESLHAQIESLRDTGAVVKVSGKLLVGIPDVNGTRTEVSELDVIEAGTQEQPAIEPFDPTADWPVFVNDRYGYKFSYPMNATLSFYGPEGFSGDDLPEGMTEHQYLDQLMKEYTDRLCVKIEYSLGWIYISAPPNLEKRYTACGPTGFGAGEAIPLLENIFIGDQLYTANGHEIMGKWEEGGYVYGETLDRHSEAFRIELEDGTTINFGALPREDATYEDYLMKTKEILLQILATYEAMP